MSAISHYMETAGVATTAISLIREHTERMRPPRALWVPFELGRPLGAPDEPDFQRRVLRTVLSLLERDDGPVILDDFPDDAPAVDPRHNEGAVCPIAFPTTKTDDAPSLSTAIQQEMQALSPWYEQSLQDNQGRSAVGLSTLTPEQIVQFLTRLVDSGRANAAQDMTLAQTLQFAAQDLRNWYCQAVAAQPGANRDASQVADWFWADTQAGAVLLALQPVCEKSEDEDVRQVALHTLVPRRQQHRL